MIATPEFYLSPDEYLDWEQKQELRYEYINGEVLAMTGGSLAHNAIALNLAGELRSHLRGSKCRPFINDVKLKISENGPYFYPDITVTCDQRDLNNGKLIQFPSLIAEVLSDSTEAFDRGNKFIRYYRKLDSLQEYLLIEQQSIGVEQRIRREDGSWSEYFYGTGDVLPLKSVGLSIPVDLLYEETGIDV